MATFSVQLTVSIQAEVANTLLAFERDFREQLAASANITADSVTITGYTPAAAAYPAAAPSSAVRMRLLLQAEENVDNMAMSSTIQVCWVAKRDDYYSHIIMDGSNLYHKRRSIQTNSCYHYVRPCTFGGSSRCTAPTAERDASCSKTC